MKPLSKAKISALESVLTETRRLTHTLRSVNGRIHGGEALTSGLRSLLEELRATGPRTVPQIARASGVSRQHVQTAVNKLVKAGLASYAANPTHRRSQLARITPLGEEVLGEMEQREQILFTKLRLSLSKKDLRAAALTVKSVRDLLEGTDWDQTAR